MKGGFSDEFGDFNPRGGDYQGRDQAYGTLADQPNESGTFWANPANTQDASGNRLSDATIEANFDKHIERLKDVSTYIETEMNRPYAGLELDDDGLHILKEQNNGKIAVDANAPTLPAADVAEYQAEIEAGEVVGGIDFSDLQKAPKVKSRIKGAPGHQP